MTCSAGSPGRSHFETHTALHPFAWIPLAVHFVELGTLLAIAYVVFRPLAAPRGLPNPSARRLATAIVQEHGRDTLSFFKLRADKNYFFSADGRAFVGYRIENGVLLLSGDPVGPDEAALAGLLDESGSASPKSRVCKLRRRSEPASECARCTNRWGCGPCIWGTKL